MSDQRQDRMEGDTPTEQRLYGVPDAVATKRGEKPSNGPSFARQTTGNPDKPGIAG